jgi:hypothetical protein
MVATSNKVLSVVVRDDSEEILSHMNTQHVGLKLSQVQLPSIGVRQCH